MRGSPACGATKPNTARASAWWKSRTNWSKINPLAAWTADDIWKYIRANNVPYNPLYDKGYVSLGCRPCTLAGTWGRFERAGRWAGTTKAGGECGIHITSTMVEYGEASAAPAAKRSPEK